MHIPIDIWTFGGAVTLAVWWYARRLMRQHSGGDYNFAPVIFGGLAIVATAVLWLGILIAWLL